MENRIVPTADQIKPTTSHTCPACGSASGTGSVCGVCGKLIDEGFQPLDAIRSSYWMQRRTLDRESDALQAFEPRASLSSDTAWACTVYSMVPYLGVLFIPLALAFGGFGYFHAQRNNLQGQRRVSIVSISVTMLLLVIQLLLWWLLYLIPELGK